MCFLYLTKSSYNPLYNTAALVGFKSKYYVPGRAKSILTGRLRVFGGSPVEGSPSPFPSCLWFGKAACVPPGRLTELPLVKLYLVFLFHLPIETLSVNDPPDALDRQKCLTALASLRHAKWFQVWILSLFVSKPEVVLSLVLCSMFFCLLFGRSMCFFFSFIYSFGVYFL